MIPLADGFGPGPGQGAAFLLMIAALLFGWIAYFRIRRRGFARVPLPVAWGSAVLCVGALAGSVLAPALLRPQISKVRPSTSAKLAIASPRPGQVVRGDPACVQVRLRLTGGRVVGFTTTKLIPDAGHIHLYLDDELIVMSQNLRRQVCLLAGRHTLRAEFVAVDHGPFSPRVIASVAFRAVA
jgi:hypothetical protein